MCFYKMVLDGNKLLGKNAYFTYSHKKYKYTKNSFVRDKIVPSTSDFDMQYAPTTHNNSAHGAS